MYTYTKLGFGDCTPDYPENDRPQCEHCNKHHDSNGNYCSHRCWYLDRVGEYKAQILLWIELGMSEQVIIETMEKYEWFEAITDSSVNRFKRAIHALFETKLAKAAQKNVAMIANSNIGA